MNVLVDGYWWADGPMSNRMVLQEIVRRWATDYPGDQMILAVPRDAKKSATVPDGVEVVHTRLRVHPAINFLELPVIARRRGTDAILAFNFAANSTTGVVFLHDVLFQSNPEWFTASSVHTSARCPCWPDVQAVSSQRRNRNAAESAG